MTNDEVNEALSLRDGVRRTEVVRYTESIDATLRDIWPLFGPEDDFDICPERTSVWTSQGEFRQYGKPAEAFARACLAALEAQGE